MPIQVTALVFGAEEDVADAGVEVDLLINELVMLLLVVELVVLLLAVELVMLEDLVDTTLTAATEVAPMLVYVQASIPLKAELRYKARGSPLEMVMARLPDASAVKISQLSKSVYWLYAWKPVLAAVRVIVPLTPAPRLVKSEMRVQPEAPFLVTIVRIRVPDCRLGACIGAVLANCKVSGCIESRDEGVQRSFSSIS